MAGLDVLRVMMSSGREKTVSWPMKAGHPRLAMPGAAKSWLTGPGPAMTQEAGGIEGNRNA